MYFEQGEITFDTHTHTSNRYIFEQVVTKNFIAPLDLVKALAVPLQQPTSNWLL